MVPIALGKGTRNIFCPHMQRMGMSPPQTLTIKRDGGFPAHVKSLDVITPTLTHTHTKSLNWKETGQSTGPPWGFTETMNTEALIQLQYKTIGASLVAQMVKILPTTWETWVWSLGRENPLEKGMATHFSVFAWRIPWTEESGGLQFTGSQLSY